MLILKYCLSESLTAPVLGLQLYEHYLPHSTFKKLLFISSSYFSREISPIPELEVSQTCARLKNSVVADPTNSHT